MSENVPAPDSRRLTYLVTTGLAGAFNLLVILVISFGLMPRVEQAAAESRENQRLLKEFRDDIEYHTRVLRRVSEALDRAERARQRERDKEEAKDKGRRNGRRGPC